MKAGFKAMERGFTWLLLLILLVAFAGCGGSGGGGTTAISGKVIDGPVSNASITVYQVTSTGLVKSGTGATGADGSFSLSIPNYNSSDYYILFVSGGTFENNGSSTGSPDMVGFLAPGGSHQVFITPVTTLIGEQLFFNGVLNQNLNSAQVDAALNQMLAVLGQIFQAMGNNSLNGISSSDPAGQTNLDQLLAKLNSIFQELANDVAGQSGESYQNAMKDLGKYIGDNPANFGKEIGTAMNGGNFSFTNFNFTGGGGGTLNISGTLNNNDQTNLGNLEKQPPSTGISNIPATFSVTTNFSVWVVNKPATPGTAGTVTKLDSSGNKIGTYTVGADPDSIAIDHSGNAWVAGDAAVTELGPTGSLLQTCSLNTGDKNTVFEDPNQVAIDPSGNVWVTDIFGYTSVPVTIGSSTPYNNGYGEAETTSSTTNIDWEGAIIELDPSNCSIKQTINVNQATNHEMNSPGPIAIDASGNVWVIGDGPLNALNPGTYLAEFSPATGALTQGPFQGNQLSALAVDPSGNVWDMDNNQGAKVTSGMGEFNASTKAYSEFNAGYGPDTVAVDPSGNIWTGGYGGKYAIEWNSSGSEIKNYNMGYYAQPYQGTIAFDPSGDAWVVPGEGVSGVVVINPSSGSTAVYGVASPVAIAISANASNNNSNGGGPGGSTTTGGSNTSPSVPSAPAGLSATAGNNQVSLSWTASSGASSYNVYRGSSSAALSTKTKIGSGATSTSYTDTTAVNGTTYYYQVTAVNSTGESAGSNEASATPAGSSNGAGFLYSVNRDGTTTVYSIDQTTGALTALESTVAFNRDAVITVDPSGKFAYVPDYGNGVIDVYSIDQTTGALSAGTPVADSAGPVSLRFDSDKFAYAGNGDNTTTICEINKTTGALTVGASVDVNNVTVVPPGNFAYAALNFVPDVYNVNQANGILTDSGNPVSNSGNNLIVAPSGKFAYDVNPSGLIDVYTINQTTGVLTQVDNSQQFGSSLDQFNIDPLGRFLYVTDYLLTPGTQVYSIDQTTGLLTAGTTADTHGASSLAFDPSGKFAYALSGDSQTIYVYTIDQTTGALTAGASVNNPNMFWSIAVQ